MPYLSVAAIDAAVDHITSTYPAIATPLALPETSVEGRPVKALKIADGGGSARTAILFIGGTHARELVNPETLISFAIRLCDAYTNGTGLAFGPRSYEPGAVRSVVSALDILIVPMLNPDGRNHCLVGGEPMWRKNRAANPGLRCRGVDLNRNYDFLFASGIGTSADSCSDVFKGPSAFSEPETRNVKWLIDRHENLACVVDVHSYSELVLHPWGDDQNQSTNPAMNFRNPAFDGQRGVVGDTYREYIPAPDEQAHVSLGGRVRDGIAAVRGRTYTVQPGIDLYPTSATAHDYAYAYPFVHPGRRRILGFTLETARSFQPGDAEKSNVITEVSAGLMEFLLGTLCPAELIQALVDAVFPLREMRSFRDRVMATTKAGKRYAALYRTHSDEMVRLFGRDKRALAIGRQLLTVAGRLVDDGGRGATRSIGADDLKQITSALTQLQAFAGPALKADLAAALGDARNLSGKTLAGALDRLSR